MYYFDEFDWSELEFGGLFYRSIIIEGLDFPRTEHEVCISLFIEEGQDRLACMHSTVKEYSRFFLLDWWTSI